MKQNKCGGWNQRRPIAKIYVWALGWSRTHCLNDSKWAKPVWRFQTERGALALRSVLAYCSEIVSFNQAKPFSDCPPHVSKHASFVIFLSLVESIQNIRDAAIKVGKAFLNWVIRGFLQNSATNPMRTSHTRGRINQVDVKVGRENLKLAFSAVCHYAPLARTLHAWNPPRNEWWIHYYTSLPFTREQSMVHPPE